MALHGLANMVTPELARDLVVDVVRILNHSRPYLRKRAVITLYRFFVNYPESLKSVFPRLQEKLQDPEPSKSRSSYS